jgi:succinate dehydrogenase/fumarate reductase-like Fe-S protein
MEVKMGYWKKRQREMEEDSESALSILCQAGALEECEYHEGEYFEGSAALEDAYKLIAETTSDGLEEQKQMHRLISSVYEENSCLTCCPICEENFGPD